MMITTDQLYQLQKKDLFRASAVLADAFRHDPIWTAMLEGLPNVEKKVNVFYETPLRHCMTYGKVYAPSANLEVLPVGYREIKLR
ncbi:MAG: hypothetical protein P1S60_16800 [Anaerolineae bacterium]|nr:hypothetical protein [Anaerolineae bacterium]